MTNTVVSESLLIDPEEKFLTENSFSR